MHFFESRIPLEYGSLQEAVAILAFKKRRQIDLLKTLVIAAASIGDLESTKKYYAQLIEEAEPEYKEIRKRRDEENVKILNQEASKEYVVKPTTPVKRKRRM